MLRESHIHHSLPQQPSCICCAQARWFCCVLGPATKWRRQSCCARAASDRSDESIFNQPRLCSLEGRWVCRVLGRPSLGWRLLQRMLVDHFAYIIVNVILRMYGLEFLFALGLSGDLCIWQVSKPLTPVILQVAQSIIV